MARLCEEVVRHLGVEPERTVVSHDGVGIASADLGVWLAVEDGGPYPVLRAEVRLAGEIVENETTRGALDELNHRGSVGRWVFDPGSGTVAVVAALPATSATVPVAAEVVSALVAAAEDLAGTSVPGLQLNEQKAVARRRLSEHPFFRRSVGAMLAAGKEPGAALRVLLLIQDALLYLTNGWVAEHEPTGSWCSDGEGRALSIRVARHPSMGYGLTIAGGSEAPEPAGADTAEMAWRLNQLVGRGFGLGAWSSGTGRLEYRVFLPNSLIGLVESDLPEPRLICDAVREVVAAVTTEPPAGRVSRANP